MSRTRPINCIIPPYILDKMLESEDREVRQAAMDTLLTTARLRGERAVRASLAGAAATAGNGLRTIFDCEQGLPSPTPSWPDRKTDRSPRTRPSTRRSTNSA